MPSLQAQVHVPGIISLAYPYQGQSITSYVRLAGSVIVPDKDKLPQGTQYLLDQLSPYDQTLVLPSHQLFGKKYYIKTITYYMDGTAVRQVSYVKDEVRTIQFTDDYIATNYGDDLVQGSHVFTIVVTAFSPQNPGVDVFDSLDLNFFYSTDTNSIKGMLDGITPGPFVGGDDHQIMMYAFDYILTQRTEGALKNDIDFLGTLYDVDQIPSHLLPYLAKTIGYDYFAGLLGNGDSIREEMRFLPDWQKSVGTKESILVLLRALSIEGSLTPLYLDLNKNILTTGVKQRYAYTDETLVAAISRQSRLTIPLTHGSFVTKSIKCEIRDSAEALVASFVWDITGKAVWQTFLSSGWLVRADGSPATLTDIESVYADNQRGGITITFNSALKFTGQTRVTTTYLYEVEAKPGRNTRLSEFFDVIMRSSEAPNDIKVKDYMHAIDIIKRSKPFRTKIRNVELPLKSADAFIINAATMSSTNDLGNPDRLTENNIPVTSVHQDGIRDEVAFATKGDFSDGFLFSWELDCNLFENRFGILHSLAIEPTLHGDAFRSILARDTLVQRGHAIIVNDDTVAEADKKRFLREVGFRLDNFTTAPACVLGTDYLGHFHTLRHVVPTSPAIQTYSSLLVELTEEVPSTVLGLFIDLINTTGQRQGTMLGWDWASGLVSVDLGTNVTTPVSFAVDTPNAKSYSSTSGSVSYTLTLVRPTSQADIEAIWAARSVLRNITFEIGQWYAIYDITADFYTDPVHLSVFSPAIALNHQGTCCGCDIDVFSTTVPATFNKILGKTYQFGYEFEIEVYSLATNEVFAAYRWDSGAWQTILANPDLSITLSPANSGSLLDDLIVDGTASYIGAPVAGIAQEWGIRACAKKVGDRVSFDLGAQYVEDFGLAQVHGGRFGIIDDTADFLGYAWKDLIDHKHNQGGQRMAAFDGYYLRGGDLKSCLTFAITRPLTSMTWDLGDTWDGDFAWDTGGTSTMTIHHFPKRQVFEFA
jgi:hypothetical protein